MKNAKIISIILICSILLMGAGYAYWNDSLTITNSVSTGELEVVFIPCTVTGDYDNYDMFANSSQGTDLTDPFQTPAYDYVNNPDPTDSGQFSFGVISRAYITDNGKTLNFSNSNLYPGSGAWLEFGIQNLGTIPVKLDSIIPNVPADSKYLQDEFKYTITGDVLLIKSDDSPPINLWPDSDPIICNTFESFINQLQAKLKYAKNGDPIILDKGDKIIINHWCNEEAYYGDITAVGYDVYLKDDAIEYAVERDDNGHILYTSEGGYIYKTDSSGNKIELENNSFNFSLNMNFTQYNK